MNNNELKITIEVNNDIGQNDQGFQDYSGTILGGLFGLATIMIAIFSIISNEVNKRTSGLSLLLLKRYKIKFLFLPIYFILTISFLMMFFKFFNNKVFLLIASFIFIVLISVQAFYILQPMYKKAKTKKVLIKARLKQFKKELNECHRTKDILDKLDKEEKDFFDLIIRDEKKDDNYITYDDRIEIYKEYFNILNFNEENEIYIKMIRIGLKLFPGEFDKISIQLKIPKEVVYQELFNFNKEEFHFNYYKACFRILQILYVEKENNKPQEKFNLNKEILKLYQQALNKKEAINYIIDFVLKCNKEATWNFGDIKFISLLLDILSKTFNQYIDPNMFDEHRFKFLKSVVDAYINKSLLPNDGSEFVDKFNYIIRGKEGYHE